MCNFIYMCFKGDLRSADEHMGNTKEVLRKREEGCCLGNLLQISMYTQRNYARCSPNCTDSLHVLTVRIPEPGL